MTKKRNKSKPELEATERAGDEQERHSKTGMPTGEQKEQNTQAERDDLLARLQRVSADYVNYQKRTQRDMEQVRRFANEELAKGLLDVLDDMERGLEAARANHEADDPLLLGMQMVHDKAIDTLGKFGLEAIEAEGQPFDPELHSAMMQEPSSDCPAQTVLRQLQRGYVFKGRTVRPSSVVVSRDPNEQDDGDDGPAEDDSNPETGS